ncbi:hypothetical protein UMM65_07700 [Aureibaculum sp. 2210JD6-5]|uniref:hypothetical protein n=1 Tax=Aureibaculum sp. 2210JD6-5 TaxID=3103957 RepID=UPI002AAD1391|nr:hypothetical protein [Aureibaculum sp. 2210JD6-5]MDY7395122.1 hypothetical protein [Aureibaculum sp. 2210JD6-5]
MENRLFLTWLVLSLVFVNSCTDNEVEDTYQNLQEYISINSQLELDEVIACAASDELNTDISYIFYYPVPGAKEIQYFETANIAVDKDDFSLYKPAIYKSEAIFNGYLERFVRNNTKEVWCIVTYKTEGKLHKSNPIRLKHQTKPTEWTDNVSIDFVQSTMPKFSWNDGAIAENAIYFQVITDKDNTLLSGTYTYDKWFQYYNLSNVVLNITRNTPPNLIIDNSYGFTLMGVSEDNWVNLVIQKPFITKQ